MQELQTIESGWEWSKVMVPTVAGLVVALTMLVINHFREGSKQYSSRIKSLEVQAVAHENRFTQFQLERESLVDKFETRFLVTENKLATVDKLTNEVTRLTNEISHQSKSIEKLENKFDKILEELRRH